MRSVRPEGVIGEKSAHRAPLIMPRPGDPPAALEIRRGWDDSRGAAPPPGPPALRLPARGRRRRHAGERHLLLPLVLEHASRRGLRALDAGRPPAAVRS